jgi:hypothetical protein
VSKKANSVTWANNEDKPVEDTADTVEDERSYDSRWVWDEDLQTGYFTEAMK